MYEDDPSSTRPITWGRTWDAHVSLYTLINSALAAKTSEFDDDVQANGRQLFASAVHAFCVDYAIRRVPTSAEASGIAQDSEGGWNGDPRSGDIDGREL